MVHDVNNANMAALGDSREMLSEMLAGDEKELSLRAISGVHGRVWKTIHSVSTIVPPQGGAIGSQEEVDLDQVIRREIHNYKDARIRYGGTDAVILADDSAGAIFTNLIGNAAKFGGADVEITISVEEGTER